MSVSMTGIPVFTDKVHTRESLIDDFKQISSTGWIENYKTSACSGHVGNVLEDLLGIKENNFALPDAGEWEIKSQKVKLQTATLLTLFHMEPEPRHLRVCPFLVKNYGWSPIKVRATYVEDEKSFRQTLNTNWSDRGFRIRVSRQDEKIYIDFNRDKISDQQYLLKVKDSEIIYPYWTFQDLQTSINKKLKNCFYVQAVSKLIQNTEHFNYCDVITLENFSFDNFLTQIEENNIFVDINARTGKNHGAGFRTRRDILPKLYSKITQII